MEGWRWMDEGKVGWKYYRRCSAWRAGGGQVFLGRLLRREAEGIQYRGLEEYKSFWGDYLDGKLKGFSMEGWRSTSLFGEIT
jgi:hypothetical protein